MTDPIYRAQEATRLLGEPLLVEAKEAIERQIFNELKLVKGWEGDDKRRALCMKAQLLDELWQHLQSVITTGKQADRRSAGLARVP